MNSFAKTPFWWEDAPLHVSEGVSPPIATNVDVAIVGAGYTGICAALFLARGGRSVQVFDRNRPGEGASSRNGGITSGNLRPSHQTLETRFGKARADAVTAEAVVARQWLYDFIVDEALDVDLQRVGRFSGALSAKDYDRQARSAEAASKIYGITSFAVSKSELDNYLATDFYVGGTVQMDISGLHPAKFHAALVQKAVSAGVLLHGKCRVQSIQKVGEQFRVTTDRGECLAREVIVATNGYTDKSDTWLQQRLVPVRSRIIATEPIGQVAVEQLVPRFMMLTDSRELSYYYRPSPDRTRILFGGRDRSFVGDPQGPTDHLRHELCRILPQLSNVGISHSWYGYVAMNRDMIPRVFNHAGKRYGVGYCGSGVVWAPWVGRKLALKILGHLGSDTGLDFRSPPWVPNIGGRPWYMPAVLLYKSLKDRGIL
ncbi:FAD-binding oxidoreductase [Ochrobactrum sp. C6C9]|uniref:NAD(P)/FAD-dependent oxidoreductase n=1 Tax=Ochrobactrum sp. C6C9 TaxID=2736662 RepID=UPI0035302FFA|nr:FAD-binding oxidoreductase [Ochrobactrum sp. C6C9]